MSTVDYANTIGEVVSLRGTGIHTGAPCAVTIHPADHPDGRVFLTGGVRIPARADYVVDTARCTVLGDRGARVGTVEHLLAALAALEVDAVLVEVQGPEVPILDGSALPFVEAILEARVQALGSLAERFRPPGPLDIALGASMVSVSPAETLHVEALVDFDDWPAGAAAAAWSRCDGAEQFRVTIAPARTFAFRREVDALLAAGLARGGSLENALVISPPEQFSSPLRIEKEWAAHKALDMLGDLALVGRRLEATVVAQRPGHRINCMAALRLLEMAEGSGLGGSDDIDP